MQVRLFANLAETAGEREIEVDSSDIATVGDALESLFAEHPSLESEILDESGDLQGHINVLLNGANIHHEEAGLDSEVEPTDELAVFPPVSGG